MKSQTLSPATARAGMRAVAARGIVIAACVFALAGCSTVKGWFDGGDIEKAKANIEQRPDPSDPAR